MPQGVPNHTTHFVLKVCGGQPGSWFPFFLCTFARNREESIKKKHYPSSVFRHQSSILCPYPLNSLQGSFYFKRKKAEKTIVLMTANS